jgi:hypothetical protein
MCFIAGIWYICVGTMYLIAGICVLLLEYGIFVLVLLFYCWNMCFIARICILLLEYVIFMLYYC